MFKVFEGSMQNFEILLNEEGHRLVTFVATPSGMIAAVFEVELDDGKAPEKEKKNPLA